MMKKRYGALMALTMALGACDGATSHDDATSKTDEAGKLGSLSLNLVGADTSGRQYRLRDASFTIAQQWYPYPYGYDAGADGGVFSTTVSSETDPDAPVISLRVVTGSYYVTLDNSDWHIERFQDGAWKPVEKAVLLSSAYQYAYVYDDGVTGVAYRFGVDGELIDFRSGELQIGIEIEQPGDAPDGGFADGGFTGGGFTGGGLTGGGFTGGIGFAAGGR